MSDEQLLEVIGERFKNRDTILRLRAALLGVLACLLLSVL
ncbi:hypothetical protein LCGC14_0207810 [marine sediment metagenome]|uniref:Uncharacterized protein n=1 Tax=marine sediment metagenome TaxID=412755 RepID=A0A0F9UGG6_9ZZZZ